MSELIDNRRQRVEALKRMIHELHDGAPVEAVQSRFGAILDHAGAAEIGALESELMAEGMPQAEVRRMCDVHMSVFRGRLEGARPVAAQPGHPVETFGRENQAILEAARAYREVIEALPASAGGRVPAGLAERWRRAHARLEHVDFHYKRKEFLVFPFLEQAGIGGPPKVMWQIHDEVRERLKAAGEAADGAEDADGGELALIREVVLDPMLAEIEGMVEKETRVFLPLAAEQLSETQWGAVQAQWAELGPGLVEPGIGWRPADPRVPERTAAVPVDAAVSLPSGHLTLAQLAGVLDTLPLDVTFVDADDRVAYFSEGRDRVFARNRAILGRRVQDCHPPASVHVVQRIVDDLRSGRRDVAEFWIDLHGRFVHIRYFAVRGPAGEYLGTLEVTQDATAVRALTGERRLLAEEGGAR